MKRHHGSQAFLSLGAEPSASAAFSARTIGPIISPPGLFRQEVSAARGECQDVLTIL